MNTYTHTHRVQYRAALGGFVDNSPCFYTDGENKIDIILLPSLMTTASPGAHLFGIDAPKPTSDAEVSRDKFRAHRVTRRSMSPVNFGFGLWSQQL